MKRFDSTLRTMMGKSFVLATLVAMAASMLIVAVPQQAAAAACQNPSVNRGTATSTVTIPATATYRVWSRLMSTKANDNAYFLEIDGNQCFRVGGTNNSSVPVNQWIWTDYKDGNTASKVSLSLTQGAHSLRFIGDEEGVKLDRVIFASDQNCKPTTASGTECDTPDDDDPPSVSITAPATGSTVSGTVEVKASASDNTSVKKVEFYVDSILSATDTTAPYSFSWNTTNADSKDYQLTAKATDAAGNTNANTVRVKVANGDSQAPTVPANVKATATAHDKVTVTWNASTDNVGVGSYTVFRDSVPVGVVSEGTTYQDSGLSSNTEYNYQVNATDIAGNKSASSAKVTVKTPNVADSQAPSTPTELTATAVSSKQINLTWKASTDNVGVKSYEVYRTDKGSNPIATVTTNSFGDYGLDASKQYSYYVKARDGAGNTSGVSSTVTAKTLAKKKHAVLYGTVRDRSSRRGVANATVVVTIQNVKYLYTTNKRGWYVIRGLETGRYNVTYQAEGYNSKSFSIKVKERIVNRDAVLQKR